MDALRWVLLFLGGLILIAIYLWGKRAESKRATGSGLRDEPQFHAQDDAHRAEETAAEDEWEIIPIPPRGTVNLQDIARPPKSPEPAETTDFPPEFTTPDEAEFAPSSHHPEATQPEASPEQDTAPAFEEVLIMHVVATDEPLNGRALAEAFRELDLSLDPRGVYVRLDDSGKAPLFGVVNMVKPGVFTPDLLESLETPGISLFLTLPGPELPMVAFREMKDCAKRLAERFQAHLEDETHSTLSPQTLTHLEERVRLFIQHRARLQDVRQ